MPLPVFNDWLAEWELVLKSGTVSAGTRSVYLLGIRQFLTWLPDSNPEVYEPAQLTHLHITAWMGHLKESGRSEGTRRVRLLSVRFWLKYIAKQADSGLDGNPADDIPLPVPVEKLVPVLSDEDLAKLLATCKRNDFTDLRDEAIIRLLLDTGIRRAELSGIDLADLDMAHQEVTVTGKGNKTRIAPFGTKTALALRKYLRARARRPHAEHPALFQSFYVSRVGSIRLGGGGVLEVIHRRATKAGLPRTWVHRFRHTWAHDMLDNGAQEGDVERLGGWSPGSKMVKRYGSSMADSRARNASRRLSRGDRV